MKPTQVFHPYQLHRDQLPIVKKYDLVCVGSPAKDTDHCLSSSGRFQSAFTLARGYNRFPFSGPSAYNGDTARLTYFCPRIEAERLGLEWKPVPLAYPRKVDFAAQIAALEEENKSLREKLAKINKLSEIL